MKSCSRVVAARRCLLEGYSPRARQLGFEQRVGAPLDPLGDGGVGRTAVGRVVLEAAIGRRIVRWRHDDAVCEAAAAAAIVHQDGVRYGGGGGVFAAGRDQSLYAIGGKYFQRALESRRRQRMRIDADIERPIDTLLLAVFADCLRDGKYVPFVEAALQRCSAVTRGAKCHALSGFGGIGPQASIGIEQLGHIGQRCRRGRLARERADP